MLRAPLSESPFLRTLAGQINAPPPIWLMRQAGRYLPEYREVRGKASSFLDLCRTPELAAEVTLQPLRRFAFDAAIVFSDILIVPYALGQRVEFIEGEGPKLEPVRDAKALAGLDRTSAAKALAPVYETIERVVAELPKTVPLIGFCGAPWTVATYMVEGGGSKDQAACRAGQSGSAGDANDRFPARRRRDGRALRENLRRRCRKLRRQSAHRLDQRALAEPRSGARQPRSAPPRRRGTATRPPRRGDPRGAWAGALHLQSRPWHSARDTDRTRHAAGQPGQGRVGLITHSPGIFDAPCLYQGLPRHRHHRLDGRAALFD